MKSSLERIGVLAAVLLSACADSREVTVARDARAACVAHEPLRQALFGELHVHTRLSFDAFPWDPPLGPRDAYRFATGEEVEIPPRAEDGSRLRARIGRPLDFAAVTDHAEGLGETGVCMNPRSLGYSSAECILYRGELSAIGPSEVYLIFGAWFFGDPLPTARSPMSFCFLPGVDCDAAEGALWQEIRDAAEEFYDRSSDCRFTTFVAYEWTGTPLGSNLHRNVIFRNEHVPSLPISKVDTGPEPRELWRRLRAQCLDAGTGCDVLAIPHNPNLSAGQQFLDPTSAAVATTQAALEPLVEIMQAKGSSECRIGFGTQDELCDFELRSNGTFFPFPRPAILGPEITERSFVRNVLKEGLRLGRPESLGTNPWRMGFVGGTDSHFGTAGNVDETTHQGTHPDVGSRENLLSEIEDNPGGLTVVWAEENTRESIFEALRRRETYATSGTRPTVRFFGGWDYPEDLCDRGDLVAAADGGGVPMGGMLAAPAGAGAPRFVVAALQDPEGTPLQAVQIVKGWVDAAGETHEQVFDLAGDRANGAGVDSECSPTGGGASSLCAVWMDSGFDPAEPAFWYVRVLENPTCRWSTRWCQEHGVNPLDEACEEQAAAAGGFGRCCNENDVVLPVVQERAWTSPIWWQG